MELTRREFVTLLSLGIVIPPAGWTLVRGRGRLSARRPPRHAFPGRIVPLNRRQLREVSPWMG